ncbi:MAG: phosphoribosyltransferase [Carbonactinosporaceae bacterium]
MVYEDRHEAGKLVAERLADLEFADPVVLGLPRGGVEVAYEVAAALRAPLDVVVARKIGAPRQPEYGIGAVGEDGPPVLDRGAIAALGLAERDLAESILARQREARDQLYRYRLARPGPPLAGRSVIVVDDGVATGVTARAALTFLRAKNPRDITFAAPVCAPDADLRLQGFADRVVCLRRPEDFGAVGMWYREFGQVSDDQVLALLRRAAQLWGTDVNRPGQGRLPT